VHVRQGQRCAWDDGVGAATAAQLNEKREARTRASRDWLKHYWERRKTRRTTMLRTLSLALLTACALSVHSVEAEELAKTDSVPVEAQPSAISAAQSAPGKDLYMVCAFYAKPGTCETVYQQAMKDTSITAEAVRAEYTGYARYLNGAGSLTDADRQYLKDNDITVPPDLTAVNQAGLHNVINDPSLIPHVKRVAVNNFVSRAVEAELYCGFNNCKSAALETATTEDRGASAGPNSSS
jgi:hypothetical protein